MSLPGARSVYDLNEDYENELAKRRAAAWATGDRAALLDEVRRLAGIRKLSELPKPRVESAGHGRAQGIPDREAADHARGRHLAAGAAVLAREAEARPRGAVRSRAGQGGRRGARRPDRAAGPGRRYRPGRRSPRDRPDPARTTRWLGLARLPGRLSRLHAGPLLRRACGRKTCWSAPATRRSEPPAAERARSTSSPSATSAFPPSMRPPWSRACSEA